MSKLQRMKELLKQKKISQNQHKKEILKAAKEEQRRQEKERRKKEHLEKKALRASVPKPSVEKPAKKPKEPSERKIVNKKPSKCSRYNILWKKAWFAFDRAFTDPYLYFCSNRCSKSEYSKEGNNQCSKLHPCRK